MGKRYAEESREPLRGDIHMLRILRAYYSAVDPYRLYGLRLPSGPGNGAGGNVSTVVRAEVQILELVRL
jgi:hypothetical protein